MGAMPPLRYYLERVLRDRGGGISHWAAKLGDDVKCQKNPSPHQNKISTPNPPKTPNTRPLQRGILWTWVFPAERAHVFQVP